MYSVDVRSRFAALSILDEDSPAKPATPPKVPKETSGDKKDVKNHDEFQTGMEKSNDSPRGRGGKTAPRGNRGGARGAYRGGKVDSTANPMSPPSDSNRPRGRGRGGRAPGTRMDRHSGSDRAGVKPTVKKNGYGTGNWGTVQDEIEVTMNAEQQQQNFENVDESGEGEVSTAPPEPQVITFSEYKATRSKEAKAESASTRKPNDGKDVFKNMIIKNPSVKKTQIMEEELKENIKQFDENDDPITFECVNEIKTYDERSKTFNTRNNESRGGARGGRGGRGAGRGRGFGDNSNNNRGGRANNAPRAPVPSITNAEEFPALA